MVIKEEDDEGCWCWCCACLVMIWSMSVSRYLAFLSKISMRGRVARAASYSCSFARSIVVVGVVVVVVVVLMKTRLVK